ncbi:MAG TPA: glycosyltransferase family 39 protein [Myxococcales bacterium]|nr:glycosyltransferase family 39 protein [Myxococcales bacterium]
MPEAAVELRGKTPRWGAACAAAIALCIAAGLWLRMRGLSAEGFGDDEVHKWLAALRYLRGDFSGDDVEHPMLMKVLIAGFAFVGTRLGWQPETITRLPNALAGAISVWVVAQLGRRLFGRAAGVCAAALTAVSTTFVGYQRIAKEDTLLGLFLMLLLWCFAEAAAAADDGRVDSQKRWELGAAASIAGMFASKYFFFLAPIPVVGYLWLRPVSSWRVPLRRWMQLTAIAAAIWVCLDWTPFLPSTWEYAKTYLTGQQTVHGSLFFMGRIYHNLLEYGLHGTPPWFYVVFAAVKLAPLTVLFAAAGLAIAIAQRRPAHRIVLSWIAIWFVVHSLISGSKWGRFFVAVLPAFVLLAAHAAAVIVDWLRVRRPAWAPAAAAVMALFLVGSEARAALVHAPHYRLYINAFGGGDANLGWFFPHCDFFDAGFREAIQQIAARAEPGAEVSTEIDWPARLYAERAGRPDLLQTLVRRGRACRSGRPCYVVVQIGRLYFLNEDAVRNLARREPWTTIRIRGEEAAKVYRLGPGESPFPDENGPVEKHARQD